MVTFRHLLISIYSTHSDHNLGMMSYLRQNLFDSFNSTERLHSNRTMLVYLGTRLPDHTTSEQDMPSLWCPTGKNSRADRVAQSGGEGLCSHLRGFEI